MDARKVVAHLVQKLEPVKQAVENLAIHLAHQLEPTTKYVESLANRVKPFVRIVKKSFARGVAQLSLLLKQLSPLLKFLANPQVREGILVLVDMGKAFEREGLRGIGQFVGWGKGSVSYTVAELIDEGHLGDKGLNEKLLYLYHMCDFNKIFFLNREDQLSIIKLCVYSLTFNFFALSNDEAKECLRYLLRKEILAEVRPIRRFYNRKEFFIEDIDVEIGVDDANPENAETLEKIEEFLHKKLGERKATELISFVKQRHIEGVPIAQIENYPRLEKRLQRLRGFLINRNIRCY